MWKKSLKYLFLLFAAVFFLSGDLMFRRKVLRTSSPKASIGLIHDEDISVFGKTNPVTLYSDYSLFPTEGCIGITLSFIGYKVKAHIVGDRRPKEEWEEWYVYELICLMYFAETIVSDVLRSHPMTVYLASGDSVVLSPARPISKRETVQKSVWSNKGRYTKTSRFSGYNFIHHIDSEKMFTDMITSIKIEDKTSVTQVPVTPKQQEALRKRFILLKDLIGDTSDQGS